MNGEEFEAVGIDPSAVEEAMKLQAELGDLAVLYVLLKIQEQVQPRTLWAGRFHGSRTPGWKLVGKTTLIHGGYTEWRYTI